MDVNSLSYKESRELIKQLECHISELDKIKQQSEINFKPVHSKYDINFDHKYYLAIYVNNFRGGIVPVILDKIIDDTYYFVAVSPNLKPLEHWNVVDRPTQKYIVEYKDSPVFIDPILYSNTDTCRKVEIYYR